MSPSRHARLLLRIAACLLLPIVLAACGKAASGGEPAVAVPDGAVCAVCGMDLRDAPGPRAQAWVNGASKPLFFDSIRDFFAWVLQPENASNAQALYVQNSALIDWQHPTNAANSFIDARRAYYVAWQPLPGSMGATLAPFANRADAEAFVARHGGAVLGFAEVTPSLVANLASHCPSGAEAAPACHAPAAGASTTDAEAATPAAAPHAHASMH